MHRLSRSPDSMSNRACRPIRAERDTSSMARSWAGTCNVTNCLPVWHLTSRLAGVTDLSSAITSSWKVHAIFTKGCAMIQTMTDPIACHDFDQITPLAIDQVRFACGGQPTPSRLKWKRGQGTEKSRPHSILHSSIYRCPSTRNPVYLRRHVDTRNRRLSPYPQYNARLSDDTTETETLAAQDLSSLRTTMITGATHITSPCMQPYHRYHT